MLLLATIMMRFVLAGLFLYAGLQKWRSNEEFHQAVLAFKLLDGPPARWMAQMLPGLECAVALALFVGIATRWMALLLLMLVLIFSGALVLAWQRHLRLACHCFGNSGRGETTSYPRALARNTLLSALALGIVLAPPSALRFLLPALLTESVYQWALLTTLMILAVLVTMDALSKALSSAGLMLR